MIAAALMLAAIAPSPAGAAQAPSDSVFVGRLSGVRFTGGFNLQTGTAGITDGTANTIVAPMRVTSAIIAILIG